MFRRLLRTGLRSNWALIITIIIIMRPADRRCDRKSLIFHRKRFSCALIEATAFWSRQDDCVCVSSYIILTDRRANKYDDDDAYDWNDALLNWYALTKKKQKTIQNKALSTSRHWVREWDIQCNYRELRSSHFLFHSSIKAKVFI